MSLCLTQGASVVARTESGDWVSLVEEGGTTTIKKTSVATQHTKDESGLHEVEVSTLSHIITTGVPKVLLMIWQ